MKNPRPFTHLDQMLPPKQQTLDFGNAGPWQQLSAMDRQACRDALAAMIYQVATASLTDKETFTQEKHEHER